MSFESRLNTPSKDMAVRWQNVINHHISQVKRFIYTAVSLFPPPLSGWQPSTFNINISSGYCCMLLLYYYYFYDSYVCFSYMLVIVVHSTSWFSNQKKFGPQRYSGGLLYYLSLHCLLCFYFCSSTVELMSQSGTCPDTFIHTST